LNDGASFSSTADAAYAPLSRLLTVGELADLLQVPPKTIYTWRYKGVGPPAVSIGRYLRFRTEDVAAWLETRADDVPPRLGARRDAKPRSCRNRRDGTR
jgi:excisionase family DNA binding protein